MRVLASTQAGAVSILTLALTLLWAPDRAAAQPTEEQVAAIKASCRSDYMSYCRSVPRGGTEAMQCLKKNIASLSAGCQQAVKAINPPAVPAAAAKPAPEPKPAATAESAAPVTPEAPPSTQDSEAKAASPAATPQDASAPAAASVPPAKSAAPAQPATMESSSSATQAKAEPTDGAKASVEGSSVNTQSAAPAAASAEPEATPPIIGLIPPRKKLMVLRNCRQDLETYCPDVSYGEGRQLHCLFSNKATLSPDCQGALAKLGR